MNEQLTNVEFYIMITFTVVCSIYIVYNMWHRKE